MTYLLRVIIAFLAGVLLLGSFFLMQHYFGSGRVHVTSLGPTVTNLEMLSDLVTLKVYIADVLISKSNDYQGSWLVKGDALIGIDLSKAVLNEKDETQRMARIQLPQPRVLIARVDHSKTKTWDVQTLTWKPSFFREDPRIIRDSAMEQAQLLVEHVASSEEHMNQARKQAEQVIKSFYHLAGWQVSVHWHEK